MRTIGSSWSDSLWSDARHAWAGIRRRPGVSALAVTTLALCIGMNVAAFAVAYGVLMRPLPYPDASRVAVLNILFHDGGDLGFSPDSLQSWLPRLRTVESAAGYSAKEVTVRSAGRATLRQAALVTESFFEVLGVPAALGHTVFGATPQASSSALARLRISSGRTFLARSARHSRSAIGRT